MSELKEIRDKMVEVQVDIGVLSTKVDMHTEQVTHMLQKHEDVLHHNPHGLVLTVDRLAQTQKKRNKWIWLIFSSIFALLIKITYDIFFM